jgi:hypothetical protein
MHLQVMVLTRPYPLRVLAVPSHVIHSKILAQSMACYTRSRASGGFILNFQRALRLCVSLHFVFF